MAETYKIYGTNRGTAIGQGIELSRSSTTRRFLLWERIESKLKITLVHQRKSSRTEWENEPSPPMSTLKAGEAKKFILSFDETEELRDHLQNLFAIVEQERIKPGFSHLVVAPENEVVVTSRNRAKIIKSLLAKGYSDDLWKALVQADPDLATELSYARIHGERLRALEEFERNLALDQNEDWWSFWRCHSSASELQQVGQGGFTIGE
jgi:Shedu protein SduA, N-terminal